MTHITADLMTTLAAADPKSHVLPHTLFGSGWFNNHMLLGLLAAVLVLLIFSLVAARHKAQDGSVESYVTKGRVAQLFEVMCVFVRDQVAWPQLGKLTDKYIYYIWTVFFFVLFCNLLGMIPFGAFAALFTGQDSLAHLSGTPTTNLGVTAALASFSFIAIVAIGIKEQGKAYFAHFAPVPFTPMPSNPLLAGPHLLLCGFLVFLEVLGLIIKCTVLAVRLFGVMMAGHIALAALVGLIFAFNIGVMGYVLGVGVVIGATAVSLLELFIALIQAFIFTFLTVLFIAAGAVHHEHDEHHEHEHDHDRELDNGLEPVANEAQTAR